MINAAKLLKPDDCNVELLDDDEDDDRLLLLLLLLLFVLLFCVINSFNLLKPNTKRENNYLYAVISTRMSFK